MLSPDTPSFDDSLEIPFSDLTLNEVGGKSGNENNNNNNNNDNNHKNSPKLHTVPSAMEYIKKNYRNTQNISTSLLGQIFTGTHIETGQVHCIKICLKDMYKTLSHRLAENPRIEIETMEKICVDNHPYITQLIDAVEDSKLYVTFLEYISTGDMCSYLQKLGHGLSQTQALKYYKQLVEAVSFMHNKGYCHLDISLENILIDKANDCIKLCDFGLSRPFLRNNKLFPASNIRPGKTGYIAPEIMAYQSFDGAKSDSFSLGVVLFIFLTGVPPFKAASPKDICFRYFFSGRTEYILREWKLLDVIPLQARQLLSKIFTSSESRISIHEIANHPWLQN